MRMKLWDEAGDLYEHTYSVLVVPSPLHGYKDSAGNRMLLWESGDGVIDKPFIVVEGFDPGNVNNPNLYYSKSNGLFDQLNSLDQDIFVINFADGGGDMVQNSQHVRNAIQYVNSIKAGASPVTVAGVSMGGVIARHALSWAEENNLDLNVSHFISLDGPQDGAVIDPQLLDYMKDEGQGGALESIAAKQLLRYNPFDSNTGQSDSYHATFFNALNNLNGDGYSHNTTNIGVAFSSNVPNPNTGDEWLVVKADFYTVPKRFYIEPSDPASLPGSYLPISSTRIHGAANKWWTLGFDVLRWELDRRSDPTFIPHESALHLDAQGNSRFDERISSTTSGFHDEVPPSVATPLLEALGLINPRPPSNLRFASTSGGQPPTLLWDASATSNVSYEVYRCFTDSGCNWLKIATTSSTTYTDTGETIDWGRDAREVQYKVRTAKQNLFSAYTNTASIYVSGGLGCGKGCYRSEARRAGLLHEGTPEITTLHGNYPNPFNPTTEIRFDMPEAEYVTLIVYDALGREVERLVDETLEAGYHSATFDASNLSNGMYLFRLSAGDFVSTGSMVLMK